MSSNNDLTVAICLYNCEKYIEKTLACIVNQTYQKFDLLIVNDCSTDRSIEKVESFFKNTQRPYKLVHFEENRGLAAGRYYVEQTVETKYILFVDADDCPYPRMVEVLHQTISLDNDLMAVGCYLEFIDSTGRKINGGQYIGDKTKEEFYQRAEKCKLVFLASNAIFNREIALSVGGRNIIGFPKGKPRYQDLCEDLDLWTRMSDLYCERKAIIVVPKVLLQYRKHNDGLSSSSFNMILRMRHIKTNLLRRRRSEKELSFIKFKNNISNSELKKIQKDSQCADSFRNGFFLLKKGNLLKGVLLLFKSISISPSYIVQKIKNNLIK